MGLAHSPRIVTDGLVLALDAGNTKSYQQNEIPEPTDVYGWYTTIKGDSNANQCTITRDTTTSSPVGNEPLKMVVTGTDPYLLCYNSSSWNLAPALQGETWVVSVYVKASTNTTIQLFVFGGNSSGGAFSPTDYSAATINVTTEWKRYSYYHTFAQSATQYVQVRLDGPDTQFGGDATGQEVWWDGLQVERVPSGTTTPGSFNPNPKTFKDLSGRGNIGTLTNSPRRDFDNSGSLVFDGTNDHVSFASASELQFLNRLPYTLEVWMYPTSNPGANTWTGIFNREDSSVGSRDGYNIYLNGSASNTFYLATERFTTGTQKAIGYTYNDSDLLNIWHHVVATYDGTTLRLYRNGVQLNSTTSTGNITNTSKTLEIGRRGGGSYFNGRLNGQKVYNKALAASEIQQNFNALRGRFGI